jgi:hypothetical protein
MARRFGSPMISNTDSMFFIYSTGHIRVKVYLQAGGQDDGFSLRGGGPLSDVLLAGSICRGARKEKIPDCLRRREAGWV